MEMSEWGGVMDKDGKRQGDGVGTRSQRGEGLLGKGSFGRVLGFVRGLLEGFIVLCSIYIFCCVVRYHLILLWTSFSRRTYCLCPLLQ